MQGAAVRHPDQRQAPAPPHQRRPRPLEDRGRPHGAALPSTPCGDVVETVRASLRSLASREGARLRRPRWPTICPRPTATASGSPSACSTWHGQRAEVHAAGPGGHRAWSGRARCYATGWPTPGSASRPEQHRRTSSRSSSRWTPPPPASSAARGSDSASPRSSWSCTAAGSGWRAQLGRGSTFYFTVPLRVRERGQGMSDKTDPVRRGQRVQPQDRAPAAQPRRPIASARRPTARRAWRSRIASTARPDPDGHPAAQDLGPRGHPPAAPRPAHRGHARSSW